MGDPFLHMRQPHEEPTDAIGPVRLIGTKRGDLTVRCLDDEHLREVRCPTTWLRRASRPRLLSEEHASMVAEAGGIIGAWPAGVAQSTLADYVDETCRLIDLVGVDHVAIGTDLDANYMPVLSEYDQFPELARHLQAEGLHTAEVDKVLGGNFLRAFEAVEHAAA